MALSRRAARTSDSPISYLMDLGVSRPEIISLAAGLVDPGSLPVQETRDALSELLGTASNARSALQYGTTPGAAGLRESLVRHLARLEGGSGRGRNLAPDDLIVTTGSQQLLQLVADVLIDPGDIVCVGAPDYFVFMDVLATAGARIRAIDMDEEGLIPEALDETLGQCAESGDLDRVKLVYCTSYHQNPSGVTLHADRRAAVLEITRKWSARHRIFLLEDAAYRELTYEGVVPPSIWSFDESGDTVILAQTFSKSFAPGLKTGYSVVPERLRQPILAQKGNHDFGSPNFTQHLLDVVMRTGCYEPHVSQLRQVYRAKRDAMLRALRDSFERAGVAAHWTHPRGGLYVWLILPEGADTRREGRLFARCLEKGVVYVPGTYCFPASSATVQSHLGSPRNTMRLSFGVQSCERIEEGIDRLVSAVVDCSS